MGRLGNTAAVVGLVVIVLSGCTGDDEQAPVARTSSAVASPAPSGPDPSEDADTSAADAALRDAIFLTAVDEIVAGTVYEGLVDATPGEFLVTADLLCERLDAGDTPDDLLVDYLDALGAGEPTAEDARLAGAILGAGVEIQCPEHGAEVERLLDR